MAMTVSMRLGMYPTTRSPTPTPTALSALASRATAWYNSASDQVEPMAGRVRLCPYYFVHGEGDAARPKLGGVLATICPADKKIIHGMTDAILAPCVA